MKPMVGRILGGIAVLFGLMTIKEGASVLFFDGEGRAAAGNYVPFVLMFNTGAGLFYVAAGVGILLRKRWAGCLAKTLAILTAMMFAALGVHIFSGNLYEKRTVAAMVLRTGFWVTVAVLLHRSPVFQPNCCKQATQGKEI
jgi:hypothetical protein